LGWEEVYLTTPQDSQTKVLAEEKKQKTQKEKKQPPVEKPQAVIIFDHAQYIAMH
jgi:hypothetical protein